MQQHLSSVPRVRVDEVTGQRASGERGRETEGKGERGRELSGVCHCRTEIRPPPTQKPVSRELVSCLQSPLLTHGAIHQRTTTGSHQQPTVSPGLPASAPTASPAHRLPPEQARHVHARVRADLQPVMTTGVFQAYIVGAAL